MKQMLALLLMLLLALPCAADIATPKTGIAVASPDQPGGTVPLYSLPDESSDVLMGYYQGALLEVLGLEKDSMVRVQSGSAEAGVQGYMKREDLRYGEAAMRGLPPYRQNLRMRRGATVYAYPDAQSGVIAQLDENDAFSIKGISRDGWVEIETYGDLFYSVGGWIDDDIGGFVHLETGLAIAKVDANPRLWHVLPVPGEMTAEQAISRAIAHVLEADPDALRRPAELFTREKLEAMWADARLVYDGYLGQAQWEVYLQTPDAEYGFNVYMTPEGELDRVEAGNG